MKKSNNPSDTKNRILEAATKLFANKGMAGTSTRDIAKEADVNLASINYHYKTKGKVGC